MVKIGFVGAGRIGSTSAYATLYNVDCDEIALVDLVEDLAVGEAMDLETAAVATGRNVLVEGGKDYSLLNNSDVIVISAGIGRKPGMTRLDLAHTNAKIMQDVVKRINEVAPDAMLVLSTNPVDVMTYVVYKLSGKSRNEVMGMGSSHDTARLKEQILRLGVEDIDAMMIGEHGDSMVPLRGKTEIGTSDWNSIIQNTKERGMEIIKRKSATYYAPASCIAKIVKAIVSDENAMIPVSVALEGEHGLHDVAIGVPALIGKQGAKILEYDLTDEELSKLRKSADIIKGMLKSIHL